MVSSALMVIVLKGNLDGDQGTIFKTCAEMVIVKAITEVVMYSTAISATNNQGCCVHDGDVCLPVITCNNNNINFYTTFYPR